ncbi:MAG: thermonuclease family protein [Candidatus Omnitrophota bacterium]
MKRTFNSIILISCFLLLDAYCFSSSSFAANAKDRENDKLRYDADSQYLNLGVKEVLSGDMIRLENGEILRLIGVDTPEVTEGNKLQFDAKVSGIPIEVLKVMGNEAKCFIEKLIDGKKVRVEFDKKRNNNYGELLGYIFISPDKHDEEEVFLNAEVIKSGYTYKIDTTPNGRYMSLFEKLHGYAKAQSSQLWQQWRR